MFQILSFLKGQVYLLRDVGKPGGVVGVAVAVAVGDGVTVAVGVGVELPLAYSMCNLGASVVDLSYACATTWPVPENFKAKALPAVHPVRFTTSCTSGEISDVLFSAPTVSHPVGDHETFADPYVLPVISFAVPEYVAGLSAAWALMVRSVG
jgi:hypothetical protein